jgi:hypothetical protein
MRFSGVRKALDIPHQKGQRFTAARLAMGYELKQEKQGNSVLIYLPPLGSRRQVTYRNSTVTCLLTVT